MDTMIFFVRTVSLLFAMGLLATKAARYQRESGHQDGDVRLWGARRKWEGNIEVYYKGYWGLICDDGWDSRGGDVVCRQLGYKEAMKITKVSSFGKPRHTLIWLDDVHCMGNEERVSLCDRRRWGRHNCDRKEAAGVVCNPKTLTTPPPPTTTTTQPTTTFHVTTDVTNDTDVSNGTEVSNVTDVTVISNNTSDVNITEVPSTTVHLANVVHIQKDIPAPETTPGTTTTENPRAHLDYHVRLAGGRMHTHGRVEVTINGKSGVICGDGWSLLEATVVCQQLGLGYGFGAYPEHAYGGDDQDKLLFEVKCRGDEKGLEECYHAGDRGEPEVCSDKMVVAGVACTRYLPDLVPNVTVLYEETRLQDRSLLYLQCAMEEDCAAKSAYVQKKKFKNWYRLYRRLLRFSSSTHNFGTSDFKPHLRRQDWEWHQCHRHYHSMQVFAHYDLLDLHNNKVAEGHKASFCLEDVECRPGSTPKYRCVGYADQGISVGCADIYRHNIDCQWIDITDVKRGNYIFRIHVNPENKVAELNYNNNAVTCNLDYTGYSVKMRDCHLGY